MDNRINVVATENEREYFSKFFDGNFLVTGVGYGNVYQALQSLPRSTKILNLGFAGGNKIPVGSVCPIGEVRNYHPNVKFKEKDYMLPGLVLCYSSGDFVTKTDLKGPCVFDMELYAILSMGFTDVESIKIVSDNLSYKEYEKETEKHV